MTDSPKTILVCTVGGSHAPIVASIRFHKPEFTYFICSSGPKSSATQITGTGNCIKANINDKNPTLPNIPSQVKLTSNQFKVIEVPADDVDAIHGQLRILFDQISLEDAGKIIADYTGGTKSMTAALLLAGLEFDIVKLYMVAGQRQNLRQVTDGTEMPVPANVERIRFHHKWSVAIAPWTHFGYAESVTALEAMGAPNDVELRDQFLAALAASRAFAAWDRFDHGQAYNLLNSQGKFFSSEIAALSQLAREGKQQEPRRLLDLRLNMLRKAEQKQYDDAVGRAYRLLEWTAQWLLKRDANIDSGNVLKDRIPKEMSLDTNDKGKAKAGLRDAWELLKHLGNDRTKQFAKDNNEKMIQHLTVRNNSILAHGFEPISQQQWESFLGWMERGLFVLLDEEVKQSGINTLPGQLPTRVFVDRQPPTQSESDEE